MIEKVNSSILEKTTEDFHKLSIQVSLNGLSFCVLDTISNKIILSKTSLFEKEAVPNELQNLLKIFLEENKITQRKFSEVVVVHSNTLFSLVPKSLFVEDEIANYLKFNAKLLVLDHLEYDEINGYDLVNAYVPFTSINNYIYDLFGEFEFQHNGSVLIGSLLKNHSADKSPICYVHISHQQMDIIVVSQKKLLLYNSFNFSSKEDFLYYLLFVYEQLQLDTENTYLKLFGDVEQGDAIYGISYNYVKNVMIFEPPHAAQFSKSADKESIDFTLLSTL